jgi:hypothetical protein
MRTLTNSLLAFSISGFLLLGACEGDGGGDPPGDRPDASARPDAMGSSPDADPGEPDAAASPADALWLAISGANDYKNWPPFPGHDGVVATTEHGASHRRAFVNETAAGDLAAMPDGSIVVKENLTSEAPADLAAITVMQRQGDDWFWASFMPDGTPNFAGLTSDPAVADCVAAGCHGDVAGTKGDYVFLNAEAEVADELYGEITAAADVYTSWDGFGAGAPAIGPDIAGGLHGAYNRTFINEVANDNEGNLADGSILVMENLLDEDAAALDAITVMKKIADIDPANGDWFYADLTPDGKVKLAGTRSANTLRCTVGGCHASGDFVFGN